MVSVDFINVGYGDAVLIRDYLTDFSMLVDCGDVTSGCGALDSGHISAEEFLTQAGVRRLDLLVLTHLHRDHSGGLTRLLEGVKVKTFWTNYLPPRDCWGGHVPVPDEFSASARCLLESMNIYLAALRAMEDQGTEIRRWEESGGPLALTSSLWAKIYMEKGQVLQRQEMIWREVLAGQSRLAQLEELDGFINNTSLRLRLRCGDRTVELPGDIYADCWERHQLSPCTVLKLPHHGHGDALSPKLLDMLRPEQAVISVSNSRTDDCPAASVLHMLRERQCPVYITDGLRAQEGGSPSQRSIHFEFPTAKDI